MAAPGLPVFLLAPALMRTNKSAAFVAKWLTILSKMGSASSAFEYKFQTIVGSPPPNGVCCSSLSSHSLALTRPPQPPLPPEYVLALELIVKIEELASSSQAPIILVGAASGARVAVMAAAAKSFPARVKGMILFSLPNSDGMSCDPMLQGGALQLDISSDLPMLFIAGSRDNECQEHAIQPYITAACQQVTG